MAERKPERGGSSPLNLNSLLALLTLVGSLWLVSHQLSSDRPVAPASGPQSFIGEQTLEARLWEDPFKNSDQETKRSGAGKTNLETLDVLVDQIRERSESTDRVLLLPVMLSGGHYSEDRESRIRSRFAIVSALGQSGYAPEDAEHMGELTISWPTTHQIDEARQRTNCVLSSFWGRPNRTNDCLVCTSTSPLCVDTSDTMRLRFEWYRLRSFFPKSNANSWTAVLLLWVDDSFFEDDPLLRLPLLLDPLTKLQPIHETNSFPVANLPDVALIGPRRSSTLHAMILGAPPGKEPLHTANTNLWELATTVLKKISIYSATPTAMDEVLVTNRQELLAHREDPPRRAVKNLLTNTFKSFQNFVATDAQLAEEVFKELALSGTDLREPDNHVVLISEWDTFYARVLSLTYEAELVRLQSSNKTNRVQYVEAYIHNTHSPPPNFHSFVYLRGLDGQTVGDDPSTKSGKTESQRAAKAHLTSVDELRNWTPDANRAEGPAQFDYLSRLGGQLADLEKELHQDKGGHIEAIGIVGSDVYDTLLILQALKPQFPDVQFFTTDLDARFLSPRERKWTRDLLVVSGYGLALHPSLQKNVAPFRDTAQTAQFAAALAALGDKNLADIAFVPPRRFEIGNSTLVDLSVSNALLPMISRQADKTNGPWLHPLTLSEAHRGHLAWNLLLAFTILVAVLATCWFWGPLRHLTFEGFQFPCETLEYSEEDIGGPDGAEALLKRVRASREPCFKWMKERLPDGFRVSCSSSLTDSRSPKPAESIGRLSANAVDAYFEHLMEKERMAKEKAEQQKVQREEEERLDEQAGAFVLLLNRMVKCEEFPPECDEAVAKSRQRFVAEWERMRLRILPTFCWRALSRMRERYCTRRFLDSLLEELIDLQPVASSDPENSQVAALESARAAREATVEIFRLRCERLVYFWTGIVSFGLLAIGLGYAIWNDTFGCPDGEPFSLTNGASEWPAEVLRLLVCASAIGFSFALYRQMREAFFVLTREFYLSFPPAADDPKRPGFLRRSLALLKNISEVERPQRREVRIQLISLIKGILRQGLLLFQPTNTLESANRVSALRIWREYREKGRLSQRLARVVWPLILSVVLTWIVFGLFDQDPFDTVRGSTLRIWNISLVSASGVLFLGLAFLTVDAALLCRGFILALNEGVTDYPEATRRHFARQRGNISGLYLNDWIDLQLIVKLTERVGQLVYYPTALLFVLILARNGWWDSWAWPKSLILVFVFSLLLALASAVILQRSAREVKRDAEESLTAKVRRLQAHIAPSAEQNDAAQAELLLEEIRALRRGAFVPFWENPVVGAVFLSSGGMTMLQVLIWIIGR